LFDEQPGNLTKDKYVALGSQDHYVNCQIEEALAGDTDYLPPEDPQPVAANLTLSSTRSALVLQDTERAITPYQTDPEGEIQEKIPIDNVEANASAQPEGSVISQDVALGKSKGCLILILVLGCFATLGYCGLTGGFGRRSKSYGPYEKKEVDCKKIKRTIKPAIMSNSLRLSLTLVLSSDGFLLLGDRIKEEKITWSSSEVGLSVTEGKETTFDEHVRSFL
jgi:hypothetical protein